MAAAGQAQTFPLPIFAAATQSVAVGAARFLGTAGRAAAPAGEVHGTPSPAATFHPTNERTDVTPPKRFKDPADLTPAEALAHHRTGDLPETKKYRAARNRALTDAGLEADREEPKDDDEKSPADHLKEISK